MNDIDIQHLISIAEKAAERVLAIYHQPHFEISVKQDNSLLTEADMASHSVICDELKKLFPSIPIISEESNDLHAYAIRKNYEYFFLVDPLDGTKEFVNRNGEFTINIALVYKNQPILGVIHVPVLNTIYYAEKGRGAYKIVENQKIKLPITEPKNPNHTRVAVSRSHLCEKTQDFLETLKKEKDVTLISAGSALKFGLIAEGKIDLYPRFSPTMEWDTAAGQILVQEVGKTILMTQTQELLQYNKPQLINPGFIVQ